MCPPPPSWASCPWRRPGPAARWVRSSLLTSGVITGRWHPVPSGSSLEFLRARPWPQPVCPQGHWGVSASGGDEGLCRVRTAPGGVGCQRRPLGPQDASAPCQAPCPSRPLPGARGARGEPGSGKLPSEGPAAGAGLYLAEQLMGLHGLYLKVAGRLKIEAFRLGRGCCPSVSPATPGSGPCSWAAAGQAGQGHSPSHPGPSPAPPAQAWAGREATGTGPRGRAAVQVPTGPSLWAWPAGAVCCPRLTRSARLSPATTADGSLALGLRAPGRARGGHTVQGTAGAEPSTAAGLPG